MAAREGREDIVQLLLDAGANINLSSKKDGDTPLIIACSEGHVKVAQKLIAAGASVNGPNTGGWTPLLYAAYYGHKEVVELLLAEGANINQVSKVSSILKLNNICKRLTMFIGLTDRLQCAVSSVHG